MLDGDDLGFFALAMPTPKTGGGIVLFIIVLLVLVWVVVGNERECAENSACTAPAESKLIDGICQCLAPDPGKGKAIHDGN